MLRRYALADQDGSSLLMRFFGNRQGAKIAKGRQGILGFRLTPLPFRWLEGLQRWR